nr:hypothetical protein Q903MT_gene691 [Picea sitchensis]
MRCNYKSDWEHKLVSLARSLYLTLRCWRLPVLYYVFPLGLDCWIHYVGKVKVSAHYSSALIVCGIIDDEPVSLQQ